MKNATLASALLIGAFTILTASSIAVTQSSAAQSAQQTCSPNSAAEKSEQLSGLEQETPFKIGGKVKPPRLLSSPTPKEHPSAAPLDQKGYAIVSFVVSSTGVPNRIHIIRSAGAFEKNASKVIDTVQHCRFQPGTKDGQPVAVFMTTEIDFSLFN